MHIVKDINTQLMQVKFDRIIEKIIFFKVNYFM